VLIKRILIVPLLVAVALAAASCGGGSGNGASSSSSTGGGGNGQRPGRPQLTASQTSCLEQQGVTLPGQGNGGRPGGGYGGGQPTGQQRQQLQQRRQKMMAAFQKCGIQAPQFGGGNGQGPAQPQDGGGSQ
jgi:hypothetical protein